MNQGGDIAAAVTAMPLPAEKAEASPHPSPLPQAGEGVVSSTAPQARGNDGGVDVAGAGGLSSRHPREGGDPATSALATGPDATAIDSATSDPANAFSQVTAGIDSTADLVAMPLARASTASMTQAPGFAPPASGAGAVGGGVMALLLVVGLILALAWLARRMPGVGAATVGNPALRVVGSLALGPRERVVVVEVGQTQLLLSVGAGGTRALHTLAEPLPATDATPSPFASLLAQHFGKKS